MKHTQITVLERVGVRPMTLNAAFRSASDRPRQAEIIRWREWAKHAARSAPFPGPVVITAVHLRKDRSAYPDVAAPMIATKAVIDGVVLAGVLPNDKPETVRLLAFPPALIVGYDGLRVIIRAVDPDDLQAGTHDPLAGQIPFLLDTTGAPA